jgi:hypothetical protein
LKFRENIRSQTSILIARLELSVGDQLKYVYDFDDRIGHRLTPEAIEAPQSNVKYLHEVARNQPEYVYCVVCQKKETKSGEMGLSLMHRGFRAGDLAV